MIASIVSFIILCLFIYGRSLHAKNRSQHIKIMKTVIVADTALVLYLALIQRVLVKVNADMSVLLMVHIFFALSTVLLYWVMMYHGIRAVKGFESSRRLIKPLDRILLPFRILTFLTSSLLVYLR
ncbi:MAG: hypothetical protein AB8E15_07570 [Bdellovibrionales bacterium]